jgi:glutathione synthase/RimK-type ligase-like ATP-grasp enzyme
VWTDEAVDWSAFDLVVLRETWDYAERHDEFLGWLAAVSAVAPMLNPADVIAWNTDKRYLRELASAGVRVVPTRFLEPGDEAASWAQDLAGTDVVVKPAVSCGSRDTSRYEATADAAEALAHVSRLLDEDRTVMVQPYLDAVDTAGETALLYLGGTFSHAIRKGPLLPRGGPGELVGGLFAEENIDQRTATPQERAVAEQVVSLIPGGPDRLLYARVDLIPSETGEPMLLELELTEPSLFLRFDDAAAGRLAGAIAARVSPSTP